LTANSANSLSPAQLAKDHGLVPKKSLGQNFLFDMNITRKIVEYAGDISNTNIIEIGSGPGGLTIALNEVKPKSLSVIEYDDRAIGVAKEINEEIAAYNADALKLNLREIAPAPRAVIANLPYNISTKLLTNWLAYAQEFEFMILMFQKEVALRLVAEPNTSSYGRLSVITNYLCEAQILFDVPPEAFTPSPKVTSSIVLLRPRENPTPSVDIENLSKVTKAAFGQRRKMLRSSLRQIFPETEKTLTALNINSQSRAQELSIDEFCKLANHLHE